MKYTKVVFFIGLGIGLFLILGLLGSLPLKQLGLLWTAVIVLVDTIIWGGILTVVTLFVKDLENRI